MFAIQWLAALITIVIGIIIYKYVDNRKLSVNWGHVKQALRYTETTTALMRLQDIPLHAKTFRPSFLVLAGYNNNKYNNFNYINLLNYINMLMLCILLHPLLLVMMKILL